MPLSRTLHIAAFSLLPLSFAAAQTDQPQANQPQTPPLINQQALDNLKVQLRNMKIQIPKIDTANIINKDALQSLIDSTRDLTSDPMLLSMQMGGPFEQGPGGPNSFVLRMDRPESRIGPGGTWWKNPELAQKLSLSADQQKRMDDIVFENKIQLVHMKATLEEEELRLEPLLNANPPDQTKALAQIGHIADTRADLEKANAKMLLSIRGVLTAQQWTQLQSERHRPMKMDMQMDRMHGAQDMHDRNHRDGGPASKAPQPPPASAPPAPPAE